ncbi:NAD(P)-binding protein [Cyanobacterium aponinum UTEX 3222]|uniref:NAD(P)/FAD-dependent oxidoreductase n=1 Tax=Cyanobacterium aponinum TaxID=379064 RepID=UPI00308F6BC8|nr:NAD(P)-binding protein [Cyanobacterium aponinum UTEX 3222]
MTQKIAVIGAGMAGLTVGKILSKKGFSVDIFDKGRGVGGRMSSRRTEWGYLDHGCQYFTVKDPLFKEFLQEYNSSITVWQGRFFSWIEDHFQEVAEEKSLYLPITSMNTLCKQMALNINICLQTRIVSLQQQKDKWILVDEQSNYYENYDWVIITAPPIQTWDLIKTHRNIIDLVSTETGETGIRGIASIESVQMYPCYSLMLVIAEEKDFGFDGLQLEHPILGWIGVNSSKPARVKQLSLIIQSNFHWAENYLASNQEVLQSDGDSRNLVGEILKKEAEKVLSHNFEGILYESLHLWRYALPKKPNTKKYYIDKSNQLAVCGDWCFQGKVESAFLSAYLLATEEF